MFVDRSVALRAALIMGAAVAVVALALGAALPRRSSPTTAGPRGPGAGRPARRSPRPCCGCRSSAALVGAALAGLPGLVGVLAGVHWLGPPLGVVLFGLWCGRSSGPGGLRSGGGLMDLGLDGKVALVTGGPRGSGSAIAAGLAAEGARVAVASRDAGTGAEAAGDRRPRRRVRLRRPRRGAGLIADVEAALGPIDVYVANTGGPPAGDDPLGFTREQWEEAHRTLVLSPMAFLERLLPGMRERGWGRVVAVGVERGAGADRRPAALQRAPARARRGVQGAREAQVAADGVTLNTVLPGRIATDRI